MSKSLPALRAIRSVLHPASSPFLLRSVSFPPFNRARRTLSNTTPLRQRTTNAHRGFYQIYGRALAKALTLAFFSYQIVYWAWLTFETEDMKDQANQEIKSLEGEVRLLDEGRRAHRPDSTLNQKSDGKSVLEGNG